jgi:outer membrane protein assembly factor BamB
MSPDSPKPAPSSLRLWPALVLVALLWGLKYLLLLFDEPPMAVFMLSFFGPVACVLLIVIWWVAGSRASRKEKLAGAGGLVLIAVTSGLLLDPTMRGFPIFSMVVPWGGTAFVAGLVASRWMTAIPRTALALAVALLAFYGWSLVRMEGVWGDFQTDLSWRWQETAEDRYLAGRTAGAGSAAVVGEVAEAEWPGFRGPGRDAVVPGLALAEDWDASPPRELWRTAVGPGWSSFAVAGRRLFTQEQRGEMEAVVAYDAETGAELWAHEYPSRFFEAMGGVGPRATPTVAGGMLFALGAEGLLHRLDPATGEVVWQADLRQDAGREPPTWGFSSSPLVVDGVVIVHAGGEGARGMLAYGIDEGRVRWGAPAGGHGYSSPQLSRVAGRPTVALVTDAGLALHDPADGSVTWRHDWQHSSYRVLQPLVVGESTLLMTTDFSGTRRLDLRLESGDLKAEERWTSRAMKSGFNDYVAHQGFLYGFDPNILACVDLETGNRRWKRGRYGNGQLLLLSDADQLLVLAETGEVVLLRTNPERLEELARFPVLEGKTWNHPALVGDRLYVRNGEEMVALAVPLG